MANLSKSGITSGATFTNTMLSNLYDCLTGTTAYDNISVSKYSYLNAGGATGSEGYGIRNNSGTMQLKNNDGSWEQFLAGVQSVSGSQYAVVWNDGGSFGADDEFFYNTARKDFGVGDTGGNGNNTFISMSDTDGQVALNSVGFVALADGDGESNGTYITCDDLNEVIRFQHEGTMFIGDDDWVGFGTQTHMEINDNNQQISCSNALGLVISNITGLDLNADATGRLIGAPSDFRLKENIEPLTKSLDKINKLRGVNFEWKEEFKGEQGHGKRIGMIAQEVKDIIPEVVVQKDGVYGINYTKIIPCLIEAVKERQNQIENLKERLDKFC